MHRSTIAISAFVLSLGLLASAEYKLVWSDEFNGNKLNTDIWTYENHCAPQNNELQCYTPRDNNVYVKDGFLYVEARQENYGNKKYTSGRINTKKSVAWKYGKFEVRAKLPKGDYLWPALWMLPRDYKYGGWAASGEIDIMEARGQNNNQVSNPHLAVADPILTRILMEDLLGDLHLHHFLIQRVVYSLSTILQQIKSTATNCSFYLVFMGMSSE